MTRMRLRRFMKKRKQILSTSWCLDCKRRDFASRIPTMLTNSEISNRTLELTKIGRINFFASIFSRRFHTVLLVPSCIGNHRLISSTRLRSKTWTSRRSPMSKKRWKTPMKLYVSRLTGSKVNFKSRTSSLMNSERHRSSRSKLWKRRLITRWSEFVWELSAPYSMRRTCAKPSQHSMAMLSSSVANKLFSRRCRFPVARNGGRNCPSTNMITSIKRLLRCIALFPETTN